MPNPPSDVTTGEIYRRLTDMDERLEKRLDSLDARVAQTEQGVAALNERTKRPGTTGALTGGGVSIVGILAWEWIKSKLGS